jgi:hypothetical protein
MHRGLLKNVERLNRHISGEDRDTEGDKNVRSREERKCKNICSNVTNR